MIRSAAELHDARERLRHEEVRLVDYAAELEESGLPTGDVQRALEPVRAFAAQLRDEIHAYERLRRGELPLLVDLLELSRALVALRVASGLTQRELAARLGVHESLVSRDEKNVYQGVTVERAAKVLEVLGVRLRCSFWLESDTAGDNKGDG